MDARAGVVTMSGAVSRLADELSEPTVESVTAALRAGVLLVTALPNGDSSTILELMTTNGVVNVASVDASAQPAKNKAGGEMINDDVDVVAPGIELAGRGWDGTSGMSAWSGSSETTPVVAAGRRAHSDRGNAFLSAVDSVDYHGSSEGGARWRP